MNIRKIFTYTVAIIVGLFILAIVIKGLSNEDDWICSNGQWVKHGNPSALMPDKLCDR